MALPISVTLDRSSLAPLDLAPLIADNSLTWATVVPGGFSSCAFMLNGDPRKLATLIPYLAMVRIVGDSGRVLFEGQVEDKSIVVTDSEAGIHVTAFGMQNMLTETSLRQIWSKRDMQWQRASVLAGMKGSGGATLSLRNDAWVINSGQYDVTNPTRTGLQVIGSSSAGTTVAVATGAAAEFDLPIGLTAQLLLGTCTVRTSNNYVGAIWGSTSGSPAFGNALVTFTGSTTTDFSQSVAGDAQIRLGAYIASGTPSIVTDDGVDFYNLRLLCTSLTEDDPGSSHAGGGFYGATLIRDIASRVGLGVGVIESGSDFTIDHLDAGIRQNAYDILTQVASYYAREWAVWEDANLSWETPNLAENQWVIPIGQFASLNLDASVVNSQSENYVLYTDAATGLSAEQSTSSSDRRNPYVLNGRTKDRLVSAGNMTATTATQLSSVVLNDIGFGPVPAAGSASLAGETIVRHAQGNAAKAWEIRAGDNVTIPELPMVDVFTQDGRGECLFHIVSAEADGGSGLVSLQLDTYGSKRSDVLLARLAAVTSSLGG